ncbi:MAG: RNA-binding cell elongation regulator Jag/EloR [Anaerolineae bacterium]
MGEKPPVEDEEEEKRRSVEATGRTVEEAIEHALEDLNATRDQVEIQVLTEGSRGMLGFVLELAEVRVTVVRPQAQPETPLDPEQQAAADAAQTILEKLMVGMGLPARVSRRPPRDPEDPVVLDVKGQDLGILIGRRGETLRALQYLTRIMATRQLGRYSEIVVDVDGYKARRERSLSQLARRMADRAIRDGKSVPLEPMPPHERRIVHVSLRDDDRVTTRSSGEGGERQVVIYPQ